MTLRRRVDAGPARSAGLPPRPARPGTALRAPAARLVAPPVALVAVLLAGCGQKNAYVPPPPPTVSVAQPLARPVTRYFELTGNTKAVAAVDLEARVQGFLEAITYRDGAAVKKGTPLFSIQRNTYQAQVDQAQGALLAQEAARTNAQTEYGRQSTLGKQEFASQARVDDAKTKLDQANAAVTEAQANLDLATINLGYTTVLAPFDGIVTNHLADVGALVGTGGPTKLASIVQLDPIYVYFNISEQQVLEVKRSLAEHGATLGNLSQIPVEIGLQSETGYPHRGKLDYVAPQVDPATGTLMVRGLFENGTRALLPGLFVRVRVPVARPADALLVRDEAIGTNQQGHYLLVVGADDVVVQRRVTPGQREGRYRVIEAGLQPGDWVVTDGVQRAIPGAKVAPNRTAAEPDAPPAAAAAGPAAPPPAAAGPSPAAPSAAPAPAAPGPAAPAPTAPAPTAPAPAVPSAPQAAPAAPTAPPADPHHRTHAKPAAQH